jgi:hypothetical protein
MSHSFFGAPVLQRAPLGRGFKNYEQARARLRKAVARVVDSGSAAMSLRCSIALKAAT